MYGDSSLHGLWKKTRNPLSRVGLDYADHRKDAWEELSDEFNDYAKNVYVNACATYGESGAFKSKQGFGKWYTCCLIILY